MRLTWSDNYSNKGRYLKDIPHHFPDFNVHFEGRSGSRLSHGLYFLEFNISALIKQFGYIKLYVWVGSCDLTFKEKNDHLSLRWLEDDSCYWCMFGQLEKHCRFVFFLSTFLQVPQYSIVRWHTKDGLHVTEQQKQISLYTEESVM